MRPLLTLPIAALLLACSGSPTPAITSDNSSITAAAPNASAPGVDEVSERQPCRAHGECPSGVCSHFKKDNGYCADAACNPGQRADNNSFYCAADRKWTRSKRDGDPCDESFECYESTCFMNPTCDLHPPGQASCRDGRCVTEPVASPCEQGGGRTVLACDEYMNDCIQSLAQHVLRTVCVPCGNGICDEDECDCNCPEDCQK